MPVSTTDFHRGTETGWSGSGGGCALRKSLSPLTRSNNGVTLASTRAMPDIAADADGNTGVIVYDSGNGGHFRVGGTSVASPLTAGFFADLDTARSDVVPTFLRSPSWPARRRPASLITGLYLKYAGHNTGNPYMFYYFDILTGNNGLAAGPAMTWSPAWACLTFRTPDRRGTCHNRGALVVFFPLSPFRSNAWVGIFVGMARTTP